MIFTSFTFAIFLIVVFLLYWLVFNRSLKSQNFLLLCVSYFFYGWWDWRFLSLLFFISSANFIIANWMQNTRNKSFRKLLFLTGLIINIGTLVIFKYFNFFTDTVIHFLVLLGLQGNLTTLNIILPIGISFYIFLALSYIIDVYQHRLTAVRNFFDALLTFSFFPIILAGPIQRPISLLPQIQTERIFSNKLAIDGLRQILWGIFMKIVIADECAIHVNAIFANSFNYSGSTLLVGAFLFTVQIYADFAGYSNIAIGIGKLLGFKIMQNFAYPYFSKDVREFWKKWNISLTTWFRDYIFLPIAYTVSRNIKSDNFYGIKTEFVIYLTGISVTWILTGLWHGANYTFIIWGLIHGSFLLINHIIAKPRKKLLKRLKIHSDNSLLTISDTLITFILIMCSWIFFRANSIEHAVEYISRIFSKSSFTMPEIVPKFTILSIAVFFIVEWIGRNQEYAIKILVTKWPIYVRWSFYYSIIFAVLWFSGKEQQFIYFRF